MEQLKNGLGAVPLTPYQELKRSVMACLLFQDSFYESGESIGNRIRSLATQCTPVQVEELAREAKFKMNIRKVPLLLAVELVRSHPRYPAARLIRDLMERASDITDFLVLYTEGRKGTKRLRGLDHQVRKGLGWAFQKFDAYQLDKYKNGSQYRDKNGRFTLWDAMRMIHPTPSACVLETKRERRWNCCRCSPPCTPSTSTTLDWSSWKNFWSTYTRQ